MVSLMQTWEHEMREAVVLAVIKLGDEQELKILRLSDGLMALASMNNVMTIGTIDDLSELGHAVTALTRALGPIEGGL